MAKIKAVAYYRMSDHKQTESIGDQRKAVEAYAKKNGYRIIREYVDEGISGWKTEQRLAFQRMMGDVDFGDFQAVLCWDQDRFSRFTAIEANHHWHLLNKAGVHIATVSQGRLDFNDFGGWLVASVAQHGKAEYCRDLSRNVCRGMLEKRKDGYWFGQAPYGYAVEGGKLTPGNPDHIAIVQRIFKMRAAGYGTHLIAKALDEDGLKTGRGKKWKSQSIRCIIERPAYVGDSVIGKFSEGKFNRLAAEPITIRDAHPAIVDRETFERANAVPIVSQAANGRGGADGARLSGLITCGVCGAPMYSLTQKNNNSYLYRCANYSEGTRRKGRKCGHCAVDRQRIEKTVFDCVVGSLLDNRPRLEKAIKAELAKRKDGVSSVDKRHVEKQLAKLDSQIEQAVSRMLLIDDEDIADAKKAVRRLRDERERVAAMLSEAETPALPAAKEIIDDLRTFDETLRSADPKTARHAIAQLVAGVVCDFERDEEKSTPKRKRYNFLGAEVFLRDASESTKEGR